MLVHAVCELWRLSRWPCLWHGQPSMQYSEPLRKVQQIARMIQTLGIWNRLHPAHGSNLIINFKNDQKLLILSSALPLITLRHPSHRDATIDVTVICISCAVTNFFYPLSSSQNHPV